MQYQILIRYESIEMYPLQDLQSHLIYMKYFFHKTITSESHIYEPF